MTPSIKHKDADEDSVMTAASSATPSFPFSRLPPELVNRIFLLACRLPPLTTTSTAQPATKRWHLTLDIPTTLTLAQVSKSVHKIATKALYSSVRLTAPSDVICLLRTLRGKPELGKLVKSLHIGANETFAASEWPLMLVRTDEKGVPVERAELWLRTLQRKKELLPKWCEVGRAWRLDPEGTSATAADEREGAVAHAIEAAMRDVDVGPYRRGYAKSKQKIGLEEWAIRLHLLQASLDLYLLQLRRIDDSLTSSSSTTPPYPRLIITPSPDPTPPKRDRKVNTVTVTVGRLWLRLTERGAVLDQFDHPIIFARTDLEATEINDYGHELIRKRLAGPHVEYFPDPDEEDDAPIIIDSDSDSSISPSAYPPKVAPNHCIPGQINRITDLLLLTPNVTNLSLNGYLHLCLCLEIPVLKRVRSLCLSPLLPFWPRPNEILFDEEHGPKLEGVERLMISGETLLNEDAERLAGNGEAGGKMPRLSRATWEVVHVMEPARRPTASPKRTYDLICRLQGLDLSQAARDAPPRHIEVRLHPDLLPSVMECATPNMRAAWESGQPFHDNGPHQVKVVESKAAKVGLRGGEEAEGNRRLHDGAREWWEAGALLDDEEEKGGRK